jgi:hypothetical protein
MNNFQQIDINIIKEQMLVNNNNFKALGEEFQMLHIFNTFKTVIKAIDNNITTTAELINVINSTTIATQHKFVILPFLSIGENTKRMKALYKQSRNKVFNNVKTLARLRLKLLLLVNIYILNKVANLSTLKIAAELEEQLELDLNIDEKASVDCVSHVIYSLKQIKKIKNYED